ncbi:UNVERIFIED_CONTAM: hypothetical protein GTU68_007897 [Idotea baltica]|nr:hypothetical protein [Idotea baltica]
MLKIPIAEGENIERGVKNVINVSLSKQRLKISARALSNTRNLQLTFEHKFKKTNIFKA